MLLIAAVLVQSVWVASAQSTITVSFNPVGGSGVGGVAVLTTAGEGTQVSLDITGLDPDAMAIATLHAGSCDAPGASFATLPTLNADQSGRARAEGQVLFRGTDNVALPVIADGEHVIIINQHGKAAACASIPRVEGLSPSPAGMPRSGGAALLIAVGSLVLAAGIAVGGGIALRLRHRRS
jgi:hypothetical protein